MHIISVKKDPKTGNIVAVREIPSLKYPNIIFEASIENIMENLSKGNIEYFTAINVNGQYREGDKLKIVNGYLKTVGNETVLDNLDNLPLFE